MGVQVRAIQSDEATAWDEYVNGHPHATLYHLYGWRNVIENTYDHNTYYLAATKNVLNDPPNTQFPIPSSQYPVPNTQYPVPNTQYPASNTQYPAPNTQYPVPNTQYVGLLPLVHLKHILFGNTLISMPFFDLGGVLADDEEIQQALLRYAVHVGRQLKARTIELRHAQPLSCLKPTNSTKPRNSIPAVTRSHKSRMILDLPDSSETLMKLFKSKLRSQIKKPRKQGLTTKIGGDEFLQDFYEVFSINMRDLGSPVHSATLMKNVLHEFPNQAHIVVVYRGHSPLACSLVIKFKDILENPWASALREYSRLSPNMLLYWSMLEYACKQGLRQFDFGRSTPDEGTYKFKEQWGAQPEPLHWHYIALNGHAINQGQTEKSKFESFIKYWQKLPVPVTRVIGPAIRKHIGL
jgi:serine/alanine adding enzyme